MKLCRLESIRTLFLNMVYVRTFFPKKTESIRILFLNMELKLHTDIPGEQPFLLFDLQQLCSILKSQIKYWNKFLINEDQKRTIEKARVKNPLIYVVLV